MGYIHDTAVSMLTLLSSITTTVGTWAMAVASNLWTLNHTAADNTSVLRVPCPAPGNSSGNKGYRLKSIVIEWINATADIDDITAVLQKAVLPAQAGSHATTQPAITYDTAHDTTAKRKTQAQHRMTMTVTTPFWIGQYDDVYLELTVDAAASAVFKLQGVVWNFDHRE